MKYNDFKIFKFSTISKKISNIKDSFSTITKNTKAIPSYIKDFAIYLTKYIFYKINNSIKFVLHPFIKVYKKIDIKNLDLNKVYRFFDLKRYNFYRVDKKINFSKLKNIPIYFTAFLLFIGFIYILIPKFYSYDKSILEKTLCVNQNVECIIKGKIYYNFFPSPRIKIKNLIVNDRVNKKNNLISAKDTAIKISLIGLFFKDKHILKDIKLSNFEMNLDFNNLKNYKKIIAKKENFIPIVFTKGKIVFFDKNNYVATINKANLDVNYFENSLDSVLKGKFLNDDIYVNLNSEKNNGKLSTDIKLKMSNINLLIETNFINSEKAKNIKSGNILIKKGKNRLNAFFDYKDKQLIIKKSNLRNAFLEGKLEGKITILPFFNFNLDLNLNSINFTKLYNYFLSLDKKKQKKLFKINKKINGKLNLSSDKIYSGYNLVKSIESRLKFRNGNISIEQFLINMGKLGASDVLGAINNDKEFTNFRFETNVFIDNQKKFLSKFGIYNKKSISSNFFISGNFDLNNLRSSFYEISSDEKLSNEDVNFIEEEFNNLMLEEGFKSLFIFPKFKEFIKSITSETN